MDTKDKKYILCVGMCVLDVIHICKEFPEEDSDRRSLTGRWRRGGNASNICSVLRQLNENCEFLGSLSKSTAFQFLIEDCNEQKICIDHCVYHDNCGAPFSSVILNETTGSRTIIHSNPNLPILTVENFRKISFEQYKWIHFEARNRDETKKMIELTVEWNEKNPSNKIVISVELENRTKTNLDLIIDADIVFLSKDFSNFIGWQTKEVAIHNLRKYVKQRSMLICAWGEEGACAWDIFSDQFYASAAYPPSKIVDSLGAGDTFVACCIHSLSNGQTLQKSIEFGCRIAGAKIGFYGYDQIGALAQKLKH